MFAACRLRQRWGRRAGAQPDAGAAAPTEPARVRCRRRGVVPRSVRLPGCADPC